MKNKNVILDYEPGIFIKSKQDVMFKNIELFDLKLSSAVGLVRGKDL